MNWFRFGAAFLLASLWACSARAQCDLENNRLCQPFCDNKFVPGMKLDMVRGVFAVPPLRRLGLTRVGRTPQVVTWVNLSSIAYQQEWARKEGPRQLAVASSPYSFTELKYVFRSLVKFGLWDLLHRIYVVLDPVHGPPSWLDLSEPKVVVVPHAHIFRNKTVLPTRNFNAIMANIHHIPNLSKWFIYTRCGGVGEGSAADPRRSAATPRGVCSDNNLLGKAFDLREMYDTQHQLIHTFLTDGIYWATNSWQGAAYHTQELLRSLFGSEVFQTDESKRPVMVSRCILRQLEHLCPAEFTATVEDTQGSQTNLHFETLYENYGTRPARDWRCEVGSVGHPPHPLPPRPRPISVPVRSRAAASEQLRVRWRGVHSRLW